MKRKIKIQEVGDIHSTYRYLEVFSINELNPFLDISITAGRELCFKYYASQKDIFLSVEEWEYILNTAKVFLPKALADEDEL